jgi:hypothetical protein
MKKLLFVSSLLMVLMIAPVVMADTVTVDRVTGYYSGSGGEFTLKILDTAAAPDLIWFLPLYSSSTKNIGDNGPSFQTFCVETDEYVNVPGGPYNVVLNTSAVAGGSGGPSPDPISVGTAFLYHQFQLGILEQYNYNGSQSSQFDTRADSAAALQQAIWWLEDEITLSDPRSNYYINLVWSMNPKADNNELYPVSVLNLYDSNGGFHQDQLVCDPHSAPEPATIFLLGSGLIGLVGYGRKKFFKK